MILVSALTQTRYAYRIKRTGGGASVAFYNKEEHVELWSITLRYIYNVGTAYDTASDRFTDWEPLLATNKEFVAVCQAIIFGTADNILFNGRMLQIRRLPKSIDEVLKEATPTVSEVTSETMMAAGQVAEALGKCIPLYLQLGDKPNADRAMDQLHWIAKNVSWQLKSDRHLYENKELVWDNTPKFVEEDIIDAQATERPEDKSSKQLLPDDPKT